LNFESQLFTLNPVSLGVRLCFCNAARGFFVPMRTLKQITLPPKPPTERQKELLRFIISYQAETNELPSLAAMADHMGVSAHRSIQDMIKWLIRKGCLWKSDDNTKGWMLPMAPSPWEEICENLIDAAENGDTDLYHHALSKYEALKRKREAVARLL
jgi:hypothetical protein